MEAILQDILVNTYNPDKQLRAQAEEALKNFIFAKGIPLFLSNCMCIQVDSAGNLSNSRGRLGRLVDQ